MDLPASARWHIKKLLNIRELRSEREQEAVLFSFGYSKLQTADIEGTNRESRSGGSLRRFDPSSLEILCEWSAAAWQ
jgi:hypothetical protein